MAAYLHVNQSNGALPLLELVAELELWWRHPHYCAGLADTNGDCFVPCMNDMHQLEMSVLAECPVLQASRAYSPGSVRRAETEVCVSGCLWGC